MNKHALIETLHDWINQRPGLEPANYMRGWDDTAGRSAYRSDARSITKDLHDARYLLDYIAIRDSITAERILDAASIALVAGYPLRRSVVIAAIVATNGMHPCNCPKRRPIYREKKPNGAKSAEAGQTKAAP
jgi:hypothetical protein